MGGSSVQIAEKNAGTITDDGVNLLRAIFWGASGVLCNPLLSEYCTTLSVGRAKGAEPFLQGWTRSGDNQRESVQTNSAGVNQLSALAVPTHLIIHPPQPPCPSLKFTPVRKVFSSLPLPRYRVPESVPTNRSSILAVTRPWRSTFTLRRARLNHLRRSSAFKNSAYT